MFGRKRDKSDNSKNDNSKYFSFYKVIGSMIEVIGFDTRNLLWIAKKNEEAFEKLVSKNRMAADTSERNLHYVEKAEEPAPAEPVKMTFDEWLSTVGMLRQICVKLGVTLGAKQE